MVDTTMPPGPTTSNETWLEFIREATLSKRSIEEASGRHRAILKRAKSAGCNPKIVMEIINGVRQGAEVIVPEMRDRARGFNLAGINVTQEHVFGGWDDRVTTKADEEHQVFEAAQAGYTAGKNGVPIDDCPHAPGTEHYVAWTREWHMGQAAIAAAMGPKAERASAARKRPARTAERATAPQVKERGGKKPAAGPKKAAANGSRKGAAPPGATAH
jgi:hypothetical protein